MSRKKRRLLPKRNIYVVIVDGETEEWYLKKMKDYERKLSIDIRPKLPRKLNLKGLFERVIAYAEVEDYNRIYWIIDFDTIWKETKEIKPGLETPIQKLQKYLTKIEALNKRSKKGQEEDRIQVCINNPCLEQWVLCHLTRSGRYFPQCIEVEKEVRKRLPLYQKTEDFFTRKKPDIYTRLKPYQAEAIKHAKQLGSFHIEEPSQAKAEMYKLIEDLLKVKN